MNNRVPRIIVFSNLDIRFAITKLSAHKNEGSNKGLSTDHLIHAGTDLSQHNCIFV